MLNIAIFAAGNGSNARAIHASLAEKDVDAKIALLVTHNPSSPVAGWMEAEGVPIFPYLPGKNGPEESLVQDLLEALESRNIGLLVLAGFMKLLPAKICQQYEDKILNVHPALIPAFCGNGMYGRRVHEAVWERGVKVTGATVHVVNDQYDEGPIVLQEAVPVYDKDSVDDIAARVLQVEHRLLPQAVQLFAQNRISISQRKVTILP